ncbi:TIGR04282 family arsenosugar biosynthesis glycosyltransferase [Albimonas sp. CAU 1670]|nr:TIGR04282 family arsenosugar biosynthesis glycosyltransferase [Albimonas sp. CAU 1670]MDF2233443.1 TIGR04282 family arsenosugar biosynthesis glycosyltransferase [Albimonas sp. CAU 1670]
MIVFAKEPRPGRVKTRLARGIGRLEAARWHRRQALEGLRRLAADPRFRVVLAVSPDAEGLASRIWPPALPRIPQGPGDLGVRMARALRGPGRGRWRGPVALIGSDIPDATPAALARAFRALGGAEAVFGPATDGGFWLVGLRNGTALPARLFEGAQWSTPHALADALATLGGRRAGFADRLSDVDEAGDLPGRR